MTDGNRHRFEARCPSPQTAADAAPGRWAGDLSKVLPVEGAGALDLFIRDKRPQRAADALGNDGRLDGMRVLEIGPLEGAHAFALTRLGADVTAVECNADAYLRCLVFKELMGFQARFLLGDIVAYLDEDKERRFDLIYCSGVLYHMADPIGLIRRICEHTDRCYVWTHYYNDVSGFTEGTRTRRAVEIDGFAADYYEIDYTEALAGEQFWGGNTQMRAWMEDEAILACFRHFGFGQIDVLGNHPKVTAGAILSFAAQRG